MARSKVNSVPHRKESVRGHGKRSRYVYDMSLSTRGLRLQRRDEALESVGKPMTREEFLAQRLAEEAAERDRIKRMREEYEQHERAVRALERGRGASLPQDH